MTKKLLLYGTYFGGAVIGAVFASAGDSLGLRFHGWLILLASLGFLLNYVGYKRTGKARDYDEAVVRLAIVAAVLWGIAASFIEAAIATEAAFPEQQFFWRLHEVALSLGRLQEMHVSLMLYGFAVNILMAASFYVLRRTCGVRLAPAGLAYFVFWGYQIFLLLAVSGHLFGIHQGKIYASAEWYADFWLLVVLCAYVAVCGETLRQRTQAPIYAANWFFLAFVIGFAFLHFINSLALPVSFLSAKSYSLFSGVYEALLQHWYRHGLIGFLLNIGFFGLLYYFLPKATGRPLYSYRLAMFHFWCVIFLYGWVAPQSLFHTALPDWLQNLAMAFGVMLLMPSIGGVINGFMTARTRKASLRQEPVILMMLWSLAFFVVTIIIGGLSSLKFLYIIDYGYHWGLFGIYFGGLGWAGLAGFAALYFLVPRLWRVRSLYSRRLVYWHLSLAVLSMALHLGVATAVGLTRFRLDTAYDDFGFLRFGFSDITQAVQQFYLGYSVAGWIYFIGILLMAYNIYRTVLLPKTEVKDA